LDLIALQQLLLHGGSPADEFTDVLQLLNDWRPWRLS
jgi:hypothetical protein